MSFDHARTGFLVGMGAFAALFLVFGVFSTFWLRRVIRLRRPLREWFVYDMAADDRVPFSAGGEAWARGTLGAD